MRRDKIETNDEFVLAGRDDESRCLVALFMYQTRRTPDDDQQPVQYFPKSQDLPISAMGKPHPP